MSAAEETTTTTTKKPSALVAAPKDTYQILYWPAFDEKTGKIFAGAGRAEYLRVIFEYANVPYEEISATAELKAYFWARPGELQPPKYPVLAPPAVRYNDFAVAQTPVAAKYLARKFGLFPGLGSGATEEKETPEITARAEQIVATVHEFIAEGRMAFHPVKNTMSYHDQVEESKPYQKAFVEDRLPRYFAHFERLLEANKEGGSSSSSRYFVGTDVSYVDLQVMVMLQVTRQQWPDEWEARAVKTAPHLTGEFLAHMEALPAIRAYLESPRRPPFAGDSLM